MNLSEPSKCAITGRGRQIKPEKNKEVLVHALHADGGGAPLHSHGLLKSVAVQRAKRSCFSHQVSLRLVSLRNQVG